MRLLELQTLQICSFKFCPEWFEMNELHTCLYWFYQKFKTRQYRFSVILVDYSWIFFTEMTNLMQCVLQYIFFSRNQNYCNIIPWASNKENLEYVVHYQKVKCNLKIFSTRSICFGICPNLFRKCKRKKCVFKDETTHCFRFT